jgi:hypothetical protein
MKNLLVAAALLLMIGISHAYLYVPGTIATIESPGSAMVKINIYGMTKEAMVVVPYKRMAEPTIEPVSMPIAGTEYSYTFPTGTSTYTFRLRNALIPLYYSWVANGTLGNNYFTLQPNEGYTNEKNSNIPLIVYLKTTSTAEVEVESWK